MEIQRVVPILTVTDVAEAIRQHTAVLGLNVVMDIGWVAFISDPAGHQLGLMTSDATAPINPDVSVFVDDVEAAYASAVGTGVEIVHPLSAEEWGVTRFFYRDAFGRVINVGTHTGASPG
jgi:predicted enzyme related to lactoylglutathione lyase